MLEFLPVERKYNTNLLSNEGGVVNQFFSPVAPGFALSENMLNPMNSRALGVLSKQRNASMDFEFFFVKLLDRFCNFSGSPSPQVSGAIHRTVNRLTKVFSAQLYSHFFLQVLCSIYIDQQSEILCWVDSMFAH